MNDEKITYGGLTVYKSRSTYEFERLKHLKEKEDRRKERVKAAQERVKKGIKKKRDWYDEFLHGNNQI